MKGEGVWRDIEVIAIKIDLYDIIFRLTFSFDKITFSRFQLRKYIKRTRQS